MKLGYLDEDEETAELTDRTYWETVRGTKKTVAQADEILEMTREFEPKAELSYNKHYIGFWVEGRPFNFAIMRPQKNGLRLEIRLPQSQETDDFISTSDLDVLDYDKRWGKYRIKLANDTISKRKEVLEKLLCSAYDARR